MHWNDRGEVARRLATRTDTLDTHAASSRVFYPIFIEIVIVGEHTPLDRGGDGGAGDLALARLSGCLKTGPGVIPPSSGPV